VWQPEPGELQPTLVDVRVYDASRLPTWNLRDVIGVLDTCYTVVETVRSTDYIAIVADPDGGIFSVSGSPELFGLGELQQRDLALPASSDSSRPANERRAVWIQQEVVDGSDVLVVVLYQDFRSVD